MDRTGAHAAFTGGVPDVRGEGAWLAAAMLVPTQPSFLTCPPAAIRVVPAPGPVLLVASQGLLDGLSQGAVTAPRAPRLGAVAKNVFCAQGVAPAP